MNLRKIHCPVREADILIGQAVTLFSNVTQTE